MQNIWGYSVTHGCIAKSLELWLPVILYMYIRTTCIYQLPAMVQVHLAGMMTDLPHHPASEPEMRGLLAATSLLLRTATSSPTSTSSSSSTSHPALVTIARCAHI